MRTLSRNAHWIVIGYMLGVVPIHLLIDSVFQGGFAESIKWLYLPLALLIFGFTWVRRNSLYVAFQSRLVTWFLAILLFTIFLLTTPSYVMALNAVTASGDTITYSGPVVQKWIRRNTRTGPSYQIDLRDQNSSRIITLTVRQERYAALSVGDVVSEQFLRGGFGLPFRWTFAKP